MGFLHKRCSFRVSAGAGCFAAAMYLCRESDITDNLSELVRQYIWIPGSSIGYAVICIKRSVALTQRSTVSHGSCFVVEWNREGRAAANGEANTNCVSPRDVCKKKTELVAEAEVFGPTKPAKLFCVRS